MKDSDFSKLTKSIVQAGKIRGGTMRPSRSMTFNSADVRKVRKKLGKSQSEFALMIGVSVATLQNWEQGRRKPEGPAQALLKIASVDPEAVVEALGA